MMRKAYYPMAILLCCLSLWVSTAQANIYRHSIIEQPIAVGPYALQGLLTLPQHDASVDNIPVVVLIWGTGQVDKHGSYGNSQIFKDIAQGLAAHGIASIRHHKRYYQYPAGQSAMRVQTEILEDSLSALQLAHAHPLLGDIHVLGFSLGGIVAPLLIDTAQRLDIPIASFVSLGSSPLPVAQIIFNNATFFSNMAQTQGLPVTAQQLQGAVQLMSLLPDNLLRLALERLERELSMSFAATGFGIDYLLSLHQLRPQDYLSQLSLPILVLQGMADVQITYAHDFAMWQQLLAHRDQTTLIAYPYLNHFFTTHDPELGYFQGWVHEPFNQKVLQDMIAFFHGLNTLQ